jgi:hypothetical protein
MLLVALPGRWKLRNLLMLHSTVLRCRCAVLAACISLHVSKTQKKAAVANTRKGVLLTAALPF